jgi:serine/threonine-protein kinase RsbW
MIHLDPLDLEIPSVLEKVEPVHQQVISYLNSTKCSDELHERAELAIIEALTNAIRHGNRENQEKLVRLRLFGEDTTLTCTVEDEGHGFQPEEIMNPLDPDKLLETGGRGVFLIKEMADLVIFENSGRRVRLVFREKT